MARQLAATVYVDGVPYGPADDVPPDVAERITNDVAWAAEPTDEGSDQRSGDEHSELERLSRAELLALADARQVDVPKSATKAELIDLLAESRSGAGG